MEIEKEVRYQVSNQTFELAKKFNTIGNKPKQVIDITCGAYGKESMQKTGRVFRVRKKGDKCTIEIKKRNADGSWIEESIPIENQNKGINFFALSGLYPYLYINRERLSFNFKSLKIEMDNVEMLGKFIEIEYQDSKNADAELEEFKTLCGITSNPAPLYGTIIFEKQQQDPQFNKEYKKRLHEIVEESNLTEKNQY